MTMELKIEKGIPLPDASTPNAGFTATIKRMEVGDSFFMPGKQPNISGRLSYLQKTTERKFATRKEGDGVRIWRTA